ncbi:glycosyltransferase family 4 protein [Candidatus Curtissbacteria bacterium]|nr:glycosyltransferase family 4 protein [Candidatus Curtissbacteria bacterium]
MRIGIDISQVVHGTGVSGYTSQLVENLAKIDKKNQYILFGASARAIGKFNDLKEKLKDHPNFRFKIVPIPPTILEILWNRLHILPVEKFIGQVDIFHSSDWTQPKIQSQVTKKVTTVHDLVVYLFPSSVHPKIIAVQKRRLNLVKKEVDIILADSQTTKVDLVKFLQVKEEKIKVVYLAASGEFKPQDEDQISQILQKYKIKKPYLLSVGTHEPRKNIQKLLDVFELIVQKNPGFSLVLVGKYGWGPNLEGYHTGENVIWTSFVPKEDLISLYSGCRVFVYPSLYEGFGLPVLEAMACGAPVVTSNNSSMAEIARDAAILVDPRNETQLQRAIEMVLSLNLENYQKMVRASLDRARRYSWIKTARETLKVYEEVAKR